MVNIISQHVDTLKFHYYIKNTIEDDSFNSYLKIVDSLISLKKEAQEAKNNYGDTKSINYTIGEHKFNIMATSISGFSVVMKNNDISIALRKTKNKINPSPVIKVEFRAEFLARKGYKKSIAIVNSFVSDFLLQEYKVKISEIHLATDIQGYHFTHLDFFKMKTRARSRETFQEGTFEAKASAYGGITTFTGFAFGGGDYHMRIYNKTKEINKFKNKSFAKPLLWDLKPNYDPNATVWRMEIQIRRAKLKKLINSDNSTMDDYDNILRGIPDLWKKATTDFVIKDISDRDSFNMLRGKRTLKNGTDKLLTKQAIYAIFKRADDLPFWEDLKTWNTYEGNEILTAYDIPKNGSFDYVSNSIKSLFSTMGKHYGSVSAKTLIQAFKESNELSHEKKQISLLEDNFNKQLDYFERVDFMVDNGVVNVPDYKDLENSIYSTVFKADAHLKDSIYSIHIKNRLDSRKHTHHRKAIQFATRRDLIHGVEAREVF